MTIKELIKLMNDPKTKMLKADQQQEAIKKKLNVKNYISIKAKRDLVESIANECVLYDEGVFKFDEIEKYVFFTMKTIEAYTNLELSDDIEDDYDMLCEAGLLNAVINTFSGEYENIKILLQMRCDYILSNNNIESQVGKFLTSLLNNIDSISGALAGKIDSFSLDRLPIDKIDLTKLLEFINKNK